MERGSDKHGRRLDEAIKHETEGMMRSGHETHAEEWKSSEPSGEDQPDVDRAPNATMAGGTPDGMTATDVEQRSELARHLHRSVFPAVREVLIDDAIGSDTPAHVVDLLRQLPAGREYANVGDVWASLGGGMEEHRS